MWLRLLHQKLQLRKHTRCGKVFALSDGVLVRAHGLSRKTVPADAQPAINELLDQLYAGTALHLEGVLPTSVVLVPYLPLPPHAKLQQIELLEHLARAKPLTCISGARNKHAFGLEPWFQEDVADNIARYVAAVTRKQQEPIHPLPSPFDLTIVAAVTADLRPLVTVFWRDEVELSEMDCHPLDAVETGLSFAAKESQSRVDQERVERLVAGKFLIKSLSADAEACGRPALLEDVR